MTPVIDIHCHLGQYADGSMSADGDRLCALFREAGIEIPFPQTELRLREGALRLDTGDKFIVDGKSSDREAN